MATFATAAFGSLQEGPAFPRASELQGEVPRDSYPRRYQGILGRPTGFLEGQRRAKCVCWKVAELAHHINLLVRNVYLYRRKGQTADPDQCLYSPQVTPLSR